MAPETTHPAPQPPGPGSEGAALTLAPAKLPVAPWKVAVAVGWALGSSALVAALLRAPGAAFWAMGVYHLGCASVTAIAGATAGPARGARLPVAKLAALAAGSCGVVVLGGALVAPLVDWQSAAGLWRSWGLAPPGDFVWLLYYASVNPWVEERYWRGTLLGDGVRARLGARGARALTLFAFLNHHAIVLVPSFGAARGLFLCVPIFLAGAAWVWFHERSGRLGWCIASHAGADAGLVVLYWWGARGA